MIHPIGHFVNPPMPKLGKLHRFFENWFILMRWFGCTWLYGSFIYFIYSSWCIWIDILGGCIHLCLQNLVGGHFWKNKPSLGFLRAWSPQIGYHDPHLGKIRKMNVSFGGKRRLLEAQQFISKLNIHLKMSKHHPREGWRHTRVSYVQFLKVKFEFMM